LTTSRNLPNMKKSFLPIKRVIWAQIFSKFFVLMEPQRIMMTVRQEHHYWIDSLELWQPD